jgi:putative glutamine amidotransferase
LILSSALYSSHYPFDEMGLFKNYNVVRHPEDLTKDSVLVVWGGADISPSLYNRAVGSQTYADSVLSRRDQLEWDLMKRAYEINIPIIGICRGAQMLCALAGGFLIQDVTNHGNSHDVITDTGQVFKASSLHHQMMFPFEVDHKLIAWSKAKLSQHYLDVDDDVDVPCEPEFVYFPKQKGIAIQWHPEFMEVECAANHYVKDKIKELL